ncbi:putative isoflavone 3'-hydroxylase [Helianthus anomalus]
MIVLQQKRNIFFQGLVDELREVKDVEVVNKKKHTMIEVLFHKVFMSDVEPASLTVHYSDWSLRGREYLRQSIQPPTDYFPTLPKISHILFLNKPSATEECLTKNDIIFFDCPHWLYGNILASNYTNLSWPPYGNH